MAKKAKKTFHQVWHAAARIQENTVPFRKGVVTGVVGAGPNARITVRFDGRPPVTLSPSQLTALDA